MIKMGNCQALDANDSSSEEIVVAIHSIKHNHDCIIRSNGVKYILRHTNPRFEEYKKLLRNNKLYVFECVKEDDQFIIIEIKETVNFTAKVDKIKKDKNGNTYITTSDPVKELILETKHSMYNVLKEELEEKDVIHFDLKPTEKIAHARKPESMAKFYFVFLNI
jgi:hypothetical protein